MLLPSKNCCFPLRKKKRKALCRFGQPLDLKALEELRCMTGLEVNEVLASEEAIEEAIEKCYHQKENVATDVIASFHQETKRGKGRRQGRL